MHPLIWRNTYKLETWEVSVNLFLAFYYYFISLTDVLMLSQLDCAIRRYSANLRCYPPLITNILCFHQTTLLIFPPLAKKTASAQVPHLSFVVRWASIKSWGCGFRPSLPQLNYSSPSRCPLQKYPERLRLFRETTVEPHITLWLLHGNWLTRLLPIFTVLCGSLR